MNALATGVISAARDNLDTFTIFKLFAVFNKDCLFLQNKNYAVC